MNLPKEVVGSRVPRGSISSPFRVSQRPQQTSESSIALIREAYAYIASQIPEAFELSCGVQLSYDVRDKKWTKDMYHHAYTTGVIDRHTKEFFSPYQLQYENRNFRVGDFYEYNGTFFVLRGFLPRENKETKSVDILGVFGESGSYIYPLQHVVQPKEIVLYVAPPKSLVILA